MNTHNYPLNYSVAINCYTDFVINNFINISIFLFIRGLMEILAVTLLKNLLKNITASIFFDS